MRIFPSLPPTPNALSKIPSLPNQEHHEDVYDETFEGRNRSDYYNG
jgi:hypothetical protein